MGIKRHLSVGINKYRGAELAGCVADAVDFHEALTRRGYRGATLLDSMATKRQILDSLQAMLVASKWGDRVILTASGHGTWVPNRTGDDAEADGRDEQFVPYDYKTAGLLSDDELYDVVTGYRRSGVGVLFIFDSCHSGTMDRAFGRNQWAIDPPPVERGRARFLPPDLALPHVMHAAASLVDNGQARQRALGQGRKGAALISACADHQVAYDASFVDADGHQRPNGAFTRAALDALQSLGGTVTLNRWLAATRARIQFDQTPGIRGTWWQRNRWAAL